MNQRLCRLAVKLHLALALLLVCGVTPLLAQVQGGGITGTVTDPSGAVVPNVKVVALHESTGVKYTAETTSSGAYVLPNLPVGNYTVTVEHADFQASVYKSVSVLTATDTTLNIHLVVGQVTQQVTVSETAAPVMVTDSAETGAVMERATIMDLPLSLGAAGAVASSGRRQIENFMFFTPGVTGNQFSKSMNGSAPGMQQVIIDGTPHDSDWPGFISQTSPPYEAMEEFKVSTGNYPPEYGRGFGVEVFTLKSGTNHIHGDVYEFLRNNDLDARGFFVPTVSPLRQNEFGGTVGGPIRKDKTFFFASYSGFWLGGGILGTLTTVPTAAFRMGDFSQLINPSTGQQIPIYDPATTAPDGNGGFTRQQISCNGVLNVICPDRLSGVAKRVMALLPAPMLPGITGNYINQTISPLHDNDWSGKVDNRFNDKNTLSVSYWWATVFAPAYAELGKGQPLDPEANEPFSGGGVRGNWDMVINPHLLNHFAFGWSYTNPIREAINNVDGNKLIQIPGIPQNVAGFPAFYISGYPEFGNSDQQPNNPSSTNLYVGTDTVSWIHGKNQVKFGGEIWRERYKNERGVIGGGPLGVFNFGNLETSLPDSPNNGAYGYGLASFMLGQVDSSQNLVHPNLDVYSHPYAGFFIEDKIQVTPKLTFSPGLRYDLSWPFRIMSGQMSSLDLTEPNPGAGFIPGALAFGVNNVVPPLDTSEWGPRVGLAYRLTQNTVLRAGYGINYAMTNAAGPDNNIFGNGLASGYSAINTLVSPNNGITPAYDLDNGVIPYKGPIPNFNPAQNNGQSIDYLPRSGDRQSSEQTWMFEIEQSLPWSMNLDTGYVGNHGEHLPSNLENINQTPASDLSLGSVLNESIFSADAIADGITSPYPGFTGTVSQALRPYPQFEGITEMIDPIGNSRYDSLQVKVEKRTSNGLAFLVSYTLSKEIDDTGQSEAFASWARGSRDTANRKIEFALDPNNPTHNLNLLWVYQIPLGKNGNGFTRKVLEGWEVNGVLSYIGGTPLSIGGSTPLPIFNSGGNNPNRNVAGGPIRTSVSYGKYDPGNPNDTLLNINAFALPPPYTIGTLGDAINVRGFPNYNEDLSLLKRTYLPAVSEAFNVEFRVETFNTFNRTIFSNPATNITSPQSFGNSYGQANQPRIIQFALKLNW